MALDLDPALEQRIQRVLATGAFREPAELLAHALDLVEAEHERVAVTRAAFLARLDESIAQAERGEGFGEEELRTRMAARRTAHPLGRIA